MMAIDAILFGGFLLSLAATGYITRRLCPCRRTREPEQSGKWTQIWD